MKDVISMNLKGKTIVLGITGGIAAYKMPPLHPMKLRFL